MKKILWLFLLVLLGVVGFGYWFVQSGEYKPYLEQKISEITERKVSVAGDVNFTLYPWLGLSANDVTISNPANFTQGKFASVKLLKLKTELLPLLRSVIKIDKVLLEDLNLNLVSTKDGRNNWSTADKQESASSSADLTILDNLSFSEFKLDDGNISYRDEKTGKTTWIKGLDLTLGKYKKGAYLPVAANLVLSDGKTKNTINGTFKLLADFGANKYFVKDLKTKLKEQNVSLAVAEMELDANAETLRASTAGVTGSAVKARAIFAVNKVFSNPVVFGEINNLQLNLRKLLKGIKTHDKNALQSLTGKMNFVYSGDSLKLNKITAKLDQTALNGSAVANLKTSRLGLNLNADSINLDRYLSGEKSDNNSPLLPVKAVRNLNIGGKIKFSKSIKYSGLNIAKPTVGFNAQNGVLRLKPLNAGVFSGLYFGGGTINVKGKTPKFSFNENLKNIDAKQLLEFLIGKNYIGGNIWLEGKANASARVNLYGNSVNSLIRTLSGPMNLTLGKGVIKGINLMEELTRVQTLLDKKIPPKASANKQTKIKKFIAKSVAKKGVIHTNNILVLTDVFKVTGSGTAALATEQLNYKLVVEVLKTRGIDKTAVKDLAGYKIPFSLKGTFASPKINIDIEALLKVRAAQELEKQKEKLKKKAKAKLKQKLEKEKARLKDKLKDKVGTDKIKQKLEDKLKDKLKGLF